MGVRRESVLARAGNVPVSGTSVTRSESVPAIVRVARSAAVLLTAGLVALLLWGLPYYTADLPHRVRHPWHAWLKPSGVVGQALGLTALSLFLFLWLYPLRKKLARYRSLGPVPRWLDVHIVAGLLVPFVAAMHAGWRFEGLIGLGYASMFVVCLSGLVGRYLYVHIPRSRAGVEMTLDEVAAERRQLLHDLATATGTRVPDLEERLLPTRPEHPTLNPLVILGRMVRDDVRRRIAVRRMFKNAPARDVLRIARREMALAQQASMLEGIQRIFKWWHAAHRPFAITALFSVLVHVAVAVAMGQTWFR